jgi:hypothetical protein
MHWSPDLCPRPCCLSQQTRTRGGQVLLREGARGFNSDRFPSRLSQRTRTRFPYRLSQQMRSREGLWRFCSGKVRRRQWSKRVCFFSQGNVIKQISESVFPLLSLFFFFFFLTDCEAAVCSGGVFLVVMFQRVSWICYLSAVVVLFKLFFWFSIPAQCHWHCDILFSFSFSNTSTQYQRVLR